MPLRKRFASRFLLCLIISGYWGCLISQKDTFNSSPLFIISSLIVLKCCNNSAGALRRVKNELVPWDQMAPGWVRYCFEKCSGKTAFLLFLFSPPPLSLSSSHVGALLSAGKGTQHLPPPTHTLAAPSLLLLALKCMCHFRQFGSEPLSIIQV